MSLLIDDSEYLKTIEAIKQDIKSAQYKAVLSVNSTLILLYYHIGQVIILWSWLDCYWVLQNVYFEIRYGCIGSKHKKL